MNLEFTKIIIANIKNNNGEFGLSDEISLQEYHLLKAFLDWLRSSKIGNFEAIKTHNKKEVDIKKTERVRFLCA